MSVRHKRNPVGCFNYSNRTGYRFALNRYPIGSSSSSSSSSCFFSLKFLQCREKKMEPLAAVGTANTPIKWDFSCNLEVDYENEDNARIVYAALAVDKELQPDKVKRQMSVSNGKLSVHFEATEARCLRASYSAFVDVLTLATKTIEEFGPGVTL